MGRDTGGELELVDVLEGNVPSSPVVTEMTVHVDETGKDVHTRSIDHMIFSFVGIVAFLGGEGNRLDRVAGKDHVYRPPWRRTFAINNNYVSNHEAIVTLAALDAPVLGD
jgi:hypothetical protein